ncbi:ribonuclease Y [Brassica rapa]|uniref:ribonuclease Y n=1 Tax=Brassica campestris TaxID=3711 RepID=UPI0008721F8B|nr:ribonuclease Y [Brassica rapa]
MDSSVFRWAREKLEKEHRESKESGKLKLEREKKDKDAAERQRRAVEASQRATRLEAIEAQMMKVEEPRKREGYTIPPWILKKTNMPPQDEEEVFRWDDEEKGAEGEVGDAPGTGKFTCNEDEEKEEERRQRYRQRLRLLAKRRKANGSTIDHIE